MSEQSGTIQPVEVYGDAWLLCPCSPEDLCLSGSGRAEQWISLMTSLDMRILLVSAEENFQDWLEDGVILAWPMSGESGLRGLIRQQEATSGGGKPLAIAIIPVFTY